MLGKWLEMFGFVLEQKRFGFQMFGMCLNLFGKVTKCRKIIRKV